MNFDNTYVSIDLDAISNNFDRIAAKAGTRVMHQILGEATVLAPGEGGVIVQFDRFVTPRTIAEKMLTPL